MASFHAKVLQKTFRETEGRQKSLIDLVLEPIDFVDADQVHLSQRYAVTLTPIADPDGESQPPSRRTMDDSDCKRIWDLLRNEFERVDVYRYGPGSIRVRVVDPRFALLNTAERDAVVSLWLDPLEDDVQAEILMFLAMTPEEHLAGSYRATQSAEFDHPYSSG
jgi:hypothetical protein